MKNMTINSIRIISQDTETAKYQVFKDGINLVLGDNETGSYIGKSSLLRSVFHSLGADSKFTKSDWEKEGPYIYILEFSIGMNNYTMLRKQELFKLYDKDDQLIFTVVYREELAEKLSSIFLDEMYLLNHKSQYSLAHPVYHYLLNYFEQKDVSLCEFRNFNYLSAFPASYYEDALYSLVGLNNKDYNEAVTKQKDLEENIHLKSESIKSLTLMIDQLKKNNNDEITAEDVALLRESLKLFEDKYEKATSNANEHKKRLYQAYSSKAEIESIINEIKKDVEKGVSSTRKILDKHICPTCNQPRDNESEIYFRTTNTIENQKFQLLDLDKELANLEREIKISFDKYTKYLDEIKSIEKSIFDGKEIIQDQLASIGVRKLHNNITNEILQENIDIQRYQSDLRLIKSKIRSYKETREKVDKYYIEQLSSKSLKYGIRIARLDGLRKLSDKFDVDGNERILASMAWLTSILQAKYKFNPESVILPLIYDNPNNANFDKLNHTKIFELLFDSMPEDGQIITSSVGFDFESFVPKYNINTIKLTNQKYQLLTKSDYRNCVMRLSQLI